MCLYYVCVCAIEEPQQHQYHILQEEWKELKKNTQRVCASIYNII